MYGFNFGRWWDFASIRATRKALKMGWGKVRSRPATTEEKLLYLQQDFDRYKRIMNEQVDELAEALMQAYLRNPNDDIKKLLVSHFGSEFFNRVQQPNKAG